jgi:putative N6-adenine-specific DNA methylase
MFKSKIDSKELLITLKTFFGLESALKGELEELGYKDVVVLNRAVQIKGTWNDVYRLNLYSGCAISVLVTIASFRIKSEKDLYDQCMKIDWTSIFDVRKSFAVKGAVFSTIFKNTHYPYLLVKDAIVDTFRNKVDDRPDINIKSPQVVFDLYVKENEVTIGLNSSGAPLFQRGYRQSTGEAPLNEVVAHGMLRLSGWDRKSYLMDPFCGSGTILIEAGFLATGLPSQMERQHFAFKNLKNFDRESWEKIQESVPRRVPALPCKIQGGDISDEMVLKARRNLRGLPFGRFIEISATPFQEMKKAEEKGVMISNPPYGVRMGEEIEELYGELGTWMKHEMAGYECWVLSSSIDGFKAIGLKPDKRIKLFNGDLECEFRKFSIYEGSKKSIN